MHLYWFPYVVSTSFLAWYCLIVRGMLYLPISNKVVFIFSDFIAVGVDDVTRIHILRQIFCEFFGTLVLVWVGTASTSAEWGDKPSVVQIAFTFGLVIAAVIHVSHCVFMVLTDLWSENIVNILLKCPLELVAVTSSKWIEIL